MPDGNEQTGLQERLDMADPTVLSLWLWLWLWHAWSLVSILRRQVKINFRQFILHSSLATLQPVGTEVFIQSFGNLNSSSLHFPI